MLSDSSRTHQPHDYQILKQVAVHQHIVTPKRKFCNYVGIPWNYWTVVHLFFQFHIWMWCVCVYVWWLPHRFCWWLITCRAVACIVAFRLSSFLMVVWLECLGPLQLPGSAHRYLQVIKKPSDSSEELQSISNEAGSSNGIKSRTIASTKETARFARRCWTPNLCGWFSHIFHPRNAHESMIAGSKPLSIIISYESEYPIISLYLPMRSPWNHPKPMAGFVDFPDTLEVYALLQLDHPNIVTGTIRPCAIFHGHGKCAETWWNPWNHMFKARNPWWSTIYRDISTNSSSYI